MGVSAQSYLENEESAEIPPRHLSLAFGPLDFLFPKRDDSIECTQQSILQLGAEINPSGGVIFSRGPRKLYASTRSV